MYTQRAGLVLHKGNLMLGDSYIHRNSGILGILLVAVHFGREVVQLWAGQGLPEAMPRGGTPRQCLGEVLGWAGPPRRTASGRLWAGRPLPEAMPRGGSGFSGASPRQCLGEALGLAGPRRGNASGRLWARKRSSSRQCLREALDLEGCLPEAMPRGGSGLGGAGPSTLWAARRVAFEER